MLKDSKLWLKVKQQGVFVYEGGRGVGMGYHIP